ncbi:MULTISPECIES: hypothetical protein [Hyphobacterium]|uniref:Uncharacterized protein n=1 Tax=Hyphobacterium vulgare TaxID=1736751 RepID=A0ABV6ZU59_9PROT
MFGRLSLIAGVIAFGAAFAWYWTTSEFLYLGIYLFWIFGMAVIGALVNVASWIRRGEAGPTDMSRTDRPILHRMFIITFWIATAVNAVIFWATTT